MIIHLKTVCPEIIGRIPNGEYMVSDGSTAQQALCQCLESKGMSVPKEEQLTNLLYVVNHHQEKNGSGNDRTGFCGIDQPSYQSDPQDVLPAAVL